MNEILGDFEAFPRKKMIPMTYSKKEKFGAATPFYLCGEKFNRKNKILLKILLKQRIIVITLENIETLLIYLVICNVKNIALSHY